MRIDPKGEMMTDRPTFIANLPRARCEAMGAYDLPTPLCPDCRKAAEDKPVEGEFEDGG